MVSFELDGRPVTIERSAVPTLLEALRDHLGATSPKAGCGIGRCGACVVLLDGRPVNACLVPPDRLDGRTVVTRDGLDDAETAPIVAALRAASAVQCGACAPGLIVSLAFLRRRSPVPTASEAEIALAGHLCRCTGYVGLRRALTALFPEAG
jgi:carbon-monoxide dehydrogenase small subunit